MIEIKLTFATVTEAIEFLADRGPKHAHGIVKNTIYIEEPQQEVLQEPTKKVRKTKSSVVGNAQPEVARNAGSTGEVPSRGPLPSDGAVEKNPEPAVTDAAQGNVTIDEVREALAAYNGAQGMDKARELLKKFGASRVTELKEADYVAFIDAVAEEV